jgi:hypothetical protein
MLKNFVHLAQHLVLPTAIALGATDLSAQCALLTATGTGAPGTTLTLTIDGTLPNRLAHILIGQTLGSSALPVGPLGPIILGLAEPWAPFLIGQTDANGDASLVLPVPASVPAPISFYAQGLLLGITFIQGGPGQGLQIGINGCTTNVLPTTIG